MRARAICFAWGLGALVATPGAQAAEARRALFKRLSMDPIELATDRPYLPALTTFFESRARRMRH